MQADPILASPDTEISPDAWGYGDPGSSGPNLTTYTDPNDTVGDYVIRDDDGNIVGVKITGPSESTDNGDGTTTNVTTTTTYNQDTGQNQTTTTTTTTDNATGETLDSSTVSSGSSGTSGGVGLVGVGLGSTSGVTGDQYARGTDALTDAIEGTDEDGNTTTFTAPTDGVFQPPENDETEYDTDGFVDDYIGQYQDFGWLPLFTESRIETSSQTCSIDGYITLSGQSIPVSFSMCEFEGHFQSLGLMLAVVCQFYAIIIAFGGVD
ncbi:MAG: hypothetical protein C0620_10860 [Desulfuromonas sp.]|nr:MAG: hypothetical protein C0620_10860 [Desulfuromonas sp.]